VNRAAHCAIAVVIATLQAAQGCVDTSAVDYFAPIVDGGTTLRDAAIQGEGGLVAACTACVTSPACSAEYGACVADETCKKVVDCLLELYCMNFDVTNLANLKPCVLECGVRAGVLSAEDPSILLSAPLILCAKDPTKCGHVCDVQ
jgi:hypothetical protein